MRSDLTPEYTREVAGYLDSALKKVLAQGGLVETHKAAILAALDITNELFQARKGEREVAARLAALSDDLDKLASARKCDQRLLDSRWDWTRITVSPRWRWRTRRWPSGEPISSNISPD